MTDPKPGARLSLREDSWLQPIDDDEALGADAEYVLALAERYVAFPDGEIARTGINPDDELELFEGLVRVAPEDLAARPAQAGSQRTAWARELVTRLVEPQVQALHAGRSDPDVSDLEPLMLECFGNPAAARAWLTSPAFGLGGARPVDLLASATGREQVRELLKRIASGTYC